MGGYTPMHLAALNSQTEMVRRLICAGADPTIRTLSGFTAAEVAQSREVLYAVKRCERHARSRSGGSAYSRASSATSLRSLWEPPSMPHLTRAEHSRAASVADGESPEYSRYASSEDEGDDDDAGVDEEWLDMRRGGVISRRASSVAPLITQSDSVLVPAALASPAAAAMAAVREQVAAQFQQLMAQFPYSIPTPSNPWPDYYQAYLNSAAFQRLSSLVPNIGGYLPYLPGSAGDQGSPKDMERRQWLLPSLVAGSAPPPAYEEIYPQQDLDIKQASAAAAAAEAEADAKCDILYGGQRTLSETPAPPLPVLLQIGRKNAITVEQQENFRRAHAAKRKGLSSDRKLYAIWVCPEGLHVVVLLENMC